MPIMISDTQQDLINLFIANCLPKEGLDSVALKQKIFFKTIDRLKQTLIDKKLDTWDAKKFIVFLDENFDQIKSILDEHYNKITASTLKISFSNNKQVVIENIQHCIKAVFISDEHQEIIDKFHKHFTTNQISSVPEKNGTNKFFFTTLDNLKDKLMNKEILVHNMEKFLKFLNTNFNPIKTILEKNYNEMTASILGISLLYSKEKVLIDLKFCIDLSLINSDEAHIIEMCLIYICYNNSSFFNYQRKVYSGEEKFYFDIMKFMYFFSALREIKEHLIKNNTFYIYTFCNNVVRFATYMDENFDKIEKIIQKYYNISTPTLLVHSSRPHTTVNADLRHNKALVIQDIRYFINSVLIDEKHQEIIDELYKHFKKTYLYSNKLAIVGTFDHFKQKLIKKDTNIVDTHSFLKFINKNYDQIKSILEKHYNQMTASILDIRLIHSKPTVIKELRACVDLLTINPDEIITTETLSDFFEAKEIITSFYDQCIKTHNPGSPKEPFSVKRDAFFEKLDEVTKLLDSNNPLMVFQMLRNNTEFQILFSLLYRGEGSSENSLVNILVKKPYVNSLNDIILLFQHKDNDTLQSKEIYLKMFNEQFSKIDFSPNNFNHVTDALIKLYAFDRKITVFHLSTKVKPFIESINKALESFNLSSLTNTNYLPIAFLLTKFDTILSNYDESYIQPTKDSLEQLKKTIMQSYVLSRISDFSTANSALETNDSLFQEIQSSFSNKSLKLGKLNIALKRLKNLDSDIAFWQQDDFRTHSNAPLAYLKSFFVRHMNRLPYFERLQLKIPNCEKEIERNLNGYAMRLSWHLYAIFVTTVTMLVSLILGISNIPYIFTFLTFLNLLVIYQSLFNPVTSSTLHSRLKTTYFIATVTTTLYSLAFFNTHLYILNICLPICMLAFLTHLACKQDHYNLVIPTHSKQVVKRIIQAYQLESIFKFNADNEIEISTEKDLPEITGSLFDNQNSNITYKPLDKNHQI